MRLTRLLSSITLGAALASTWPAVAAPDAKPIKIGSVSALTGPIAFPDAPRAAKAYFDAINAAGGIKGRPIEYVLLDEMPTPETAARAAEKLIADPEIVVLAGGSGLLDCTVNAERYAKAGLMAVQGASVTPECFSSPNIVPMNNGPYAGLASAILFARKQLKVAQPCVAVLDLPGLIGGYRRALDGLQRKTGEASPAIEIVPISGDPTAVLTTFGGKGCKSIIYTGHEPAVKQWMEGVSKAGDTFKGVSWIFLTPAYTATLAKELPALADPIYAMSEFEPWNSSSLPLLDWKRLMGKAGLPATALSQGGYIAAQHVAKVLRGIDGPITRESVARALRTTGPVEHPMIGMQVVIGDEKSHNPNRAAMPMQLIGGTWRIAAPAWIEVPPLFAE